MTDFLGFTILGLATGGAYAVAASGLVVTYATSGIFNIAHGAVGMVMAFVYWQLRFDWGWPAPLALALVLLVLAPLFGVIVERVLMRNLAGASTTTTLVVTVGLLVSLMALANLLWPPAGRRFDGFFGSSSVRLFEVNVPWHRVITVLAAVAIAAGLRLLLYRTRTGVAMRAVVDDRSLASLTGGRPDRASMLSWALGSSLAALSGILLAPLLQLNVETLTLLVVNAYAAAMVGRLRNLPLTFLGALVLALAQTYAIGYLPTTEVAWLSGLRPAIPVIMLFVVLLVLPEAPLRGFGVPRQRERAPAPALRSALVGAALLVATTWAVSGLLSASDLARVGQGLAFALVMLSLVPLTGYGGQISLAQMSFAGLGAFAMAEIGGDGSPVGLLAAAVLAGAVGAVIALPALRLRGLYLALATMAFAVFMDYLVFPQRGVFSQGSVPVGRLDLPFVSVEGERAYVVLLAVAFGLLGLAVVGLRRGPFGRRLLAMNDSPGACATLGLDLTRTKLAVFALSAAMAGVAGALYGGLRTTVGGGDFVMFTSLPILLLAVVGGISAVSGALLGGLLLAAFPLVGDLVPSVADLVLLGPGLVGISLGRNPSGAVAEIADGLRRRRGAREPAGATPGDRSDGFDRPLGEPFSDEEAQELDHVLDLDVGACR